MKLSNYFVVLDKNSKEILEEFMKKTMQIKLSNGKITVAKVLDDGTCELIVEVADVESTSEVKISDDTFVLIKASELSLDDEFMKFNSQDKRIKRVKELLTKVIKKGVKDFYRPRLDPSFTEGENGICFVAGKKPALGKSYTWWETSAKAFNKKCRIGTKSEYIAFLGVLIKTLVAEGWDLADAWDAVCNDSELLGHYYNSNNAKHDFESTGSREVFGFYDLANTCKILSDDEGNGGFWLAGGCSGNISNRCPLADLCHFNDRNYDDDFSVGWLVLESSTAH